MAALLGGAYHVGGGQAPQRYGEPRRVGVRVFAVGEHHGVDVAEVTERVEMGHEVGRADLLLELDEQANVDRQPLLHGQPCAHGRNVAVPAADIVARAAAVETTVLLDRLEWRGIPFFRLVRRLDVGVPVDEQRRQAVASPPLGGDYRKSPGELLQRALARSHSPGKRFEILPDPPGEFQHVVGGRPACSSRGNRRVGDVLRDTVDGVVEAGVRLVDDFPEVGGHLGSPFWLVPIA